MDCEYGIVSARAFDDGRKTPSAARQTTPILFTLSAYTGSGRFAVGLAPGVRSPRLGVDRGHAGRRAAGARILEVVGADGRQRGASGDACDQDGERSPARPGG